MSLLQDSKLFLIEIKKIAKKKKEVEIAIVGKYFGTGDYQLRDS